MTITKAQKRILRDLCRKYEVRYRIVPKTYNDGDMWCYTDTEIVYLANTRYTKRKFISLVLHEICHILSARQGYFKIYNSINNYDIVCKKTVRIIIRSTWRVERHVDKMAESLMKTSFPEIKYMPAYCDTLEDRKWVDEHCLKDWRILLAELNQ